MSKIKNKKQLRFSRSLIDLKKNTIFHRVYYKIIDFNIPYRYRRFIKYAVVGLVGTGVDVLLLYILANILDVFYIVAAIISDVARGFTNFNLHKNFAFKDKEKAFSRQNIINFVKYYFINITSVLLVFLLMVFFVEICNIGFILSKMLADLIMNLYKYTFHSRLVFKKKTL